MCKENKPALKIGIIKELNDVLKDSKEFNNLKAWLQEREFEINEVSIPSIKLSLPVYYILAPAEATSNLGRFDGVKYSKRAQNSNSVDEIYENSRSQGFGAEVKRRIMLGNFVLSSGYFDAYYNKAKKIQQRLKQEFASAYENCDLILLPTTFGEAYKIGELTNPVDMYAEDLFTIPANIASLPALSIPYGKGPNSMPLGVQILGNKLEEEKIYALASYLEKEYKWEGR